MIHAGVPALFGLGLEGSHVATFWLLLQGDERCILAFWANTLNCLLD